MTIGKLASESGVPASTIRYCERIGVLPPPARSGGQRRYPQDMADRLTALRLAQKCGFRLDEVRHLLNGFGPGIPAARRWQALALRKKQELDDQMERLKAMRQLVDRVLQCRCVELVECGRIAAADKEWVKA